MTAIEVQEWLAEVPALALGRRGHQAPGGRAIKSCPAGAGERGRGGMCCAGGDPRQPTHMGLSIDSGSRHPAANPPNSGEGEGMRMRMRMRMGGRGYI